MRDLLASIEHEFRRYKALAEAAMAQADEADLSRVTPGFDNSIAVLVWHISGNLKSRFTEFLASDGEKPWRQRDEEFVARAVTREDLVNKWEEGWAALFRALGDLSDDDLKREVTIRQERLAVEQALHRSLAHAAYHVGQIVYIAKSARAGEWKFLSILPKQLRER
jgi:hypothetical protein